MSTPLPPFPLSLKGEGEKSNLGVSPSPPVRGVLPPLNSPRFKLGLVARLLFFLLLLFLTACGQGVLVVRAIDGDTIVLQGGGRVRYIGIDAPELDEPFGREAWQANQELVEGKRVRLEQDITNRDRYGRLLRYVYVDGLLVEGELVRRGLAQAKAYPPDTKYQELLQALEREAKEAGRGIWGASQRLEISLSAQ